MKAIDKFGNDPTVQRTRKLFSLMERMDKALFESLKLSQFDERLRTIREIRQSLYEKSFSRAIYKGLFMDEETALELFSHCQKKAVTKCGFKYPLQYTDNPQITALMEEESV
jgi:hypothetical protein